MFLISFMILYCKSIIIRIIKVKDVKKSSLSKQCLKPSVLYTNYLIFQYIVHVNFWNAFQGKLKKNKCCTLGIRRTVFWAGRVGRLSWALLKGRRHLRPRDIKGTEKRVILEIRAVKKERK